MFLLPMSHKCLILSWQESVTIATVTPSRMTESDSTLNLSRSTIFSLTISYCIIEYHLGKVSFEGTIILVAWEYSNLIIYHSLMSQVSFKFQVSLMLNKLLKSHFLHFFWKTILSSSWPWLWPMVLGLVSLVTNLATPSLGQPGHQPDET